MADIPADVPVVHTKEELEMAKAELQALTPEAYLDMVRYIKMVEENAVLPEARGIAFTELYGIHGGKINVTARGNTLREAVDELIDGIHHLMQRQAHMSWSPQRSSAPSAHAPAAPVTQTPMPVFDKPVVASAPGEPEYVPVGATAPAPATTGAQDEGLVTITVTAIAHAISKNGKHYLKVFGDPGFGQYGVSAWPEVIPAAGYDQWPTEQKFQPPSNMAKALVSTNSPKKVTMFMAA